MDAPSPYQRWKLTLEYDGTAFHGWQKQAQTPLTAQEALYDALRAFCRHPLCGQHITAAGRTDRGVHALAQVAHVDMPPLSSLTPHAMRDGVNDHLRQQHHDALVVLDATPVPPHFHARFNATERHYLYRILNRQAPSSLERQRAWHVRHPLNLHHMNDACQLLTGWHDFSSFRASGCQGKNPQRHLHTLYVSQHESILCVHATAPSFLYKQVRILTATLVYVGMGRYTQDTIRAIFNAKKRHHATPTAPAHGLYLRHITYPPP
ncbi:MAG: tRNA pseudouridine(38-40) synthase TruA [Alphaproteobacteria bacterium GM7ARS4]|nr:tRNA pseudouridine(38-40) synthase TruA [Alphaproteobacteria bacterium GM7ARS4]